MRPVRPPAADLAVDETLARRLLSSYDPSLARGVITRVAEGWDNVVFRVGADLALRLPRRAAAATLLRNEVSWLPRLPLELTLATPQPVFMGRSSNGYPYPWAVVRWIPGRAVGPSALADDQEAAGALARFLAGLHQPAPPDAPQNPFRGGPLADCRGRLRELQQKLEREDLLPEFDRLIEVARYQGPPLWLHGDCHPLNIIRADQRVTGVIDWGDMTGGDPATDLACAWLTFDAGARAAFWAEYPCDEATRLRAQAWALYISAAALANGRGDAALTGMGATGLRRVLAAGRSIT